MIADRFVVAGIMATVLSISAALAQDAPPHDLLLANLWLQRSVESKGNALTVYALAQIRLDQALTDENWTAAPLEQKGDYKESAARGYPGPRRNCAR